MTAKEMSVESEHIHFQLLSSVYQLYQCHGENHTAQIPKGCVKVREVRY